MQQCTFDKLESGSKAGIIVMVLIVAAVSGIGAGVIGWNAGMENERVANRAIDTALDVVIAEDFYVTFNQSDAVLHPANSSYNCSAVLFVAIKVNPGDFDALMAFMKNNPGYYFSPDNVTDVVGGNFQSGMTLEILTNQMYVFGGTMRPDARLDGERYDVDFGRYVTMFFFQITIFINGTDQMTYSFGFEENADFIDAINDGKANYDAFNAATFIRGQHSLVIGGLLVDLDDYMKSLVVVNYDGNAMLLPYAIVF